MRNFLIPTQLTPDTISAVKTVLNHSKNKKTKIILLLVTDEIDSYSSAQYLRERGSIITHKELDILDSCRELIEQFPNCQFEFKRQSGITAPLLKNILQFYTVDLIILTKTILASKKKTLIHLVNTVEKQKVSILRLINDFSIQLNKAIYLEDALSRINIEDVQDFMQNQFQLQEISQILKKEHEASENANFLLSEILSQNNIDFIIETRVTEQSKTKKKKIGLKQLFNIPILSLHEEMI